MVLLEDQAVAVRVRDDSPKVAPEGQGGDSVTLGSQMGGQLGEDGLSTDPGGLQGGSHRQRIEVAKGTQDLWGPRVGLWPEPIAWSSNRN